MILLQLMKRFKMNWPWKKKQDEQEEIEIEVPKHQHVFKDLPWYMNVQYSGENHTASYRIIEPYLCVICGERKNITLEEEHYSNINSEERENIYRKVRQRYKKYLKPRAVVEDMINNILLVKDIHYLNMVEEMRGLPHKNCGTSTETLQKKETEFKINVPRSDKNEMDTR